MFLFLVVFPFLMACFAAAVASNRLRPWLLPVTGVTHTTLLIALLWRQTATVEKAWLAPDPLGNLFLLVISVLFLCCSFYSVGYLSHHPERSNRVFCVCLSCFLGVAGLVAWSRHLGLTWVAIEATTLVTAPLIFFNRSPQSIEATWKYLLVSFAGIALALLGTFCLAYAALHSGLPCTLELHDLLAHAPQLSKPWLRAGFVLLLVGYGTKMGLAPMHAWLPDAHGEAPSPVSALLSGALLPCAFLALLRVYQVCVAAGETAYVARLLLPMGVCSMAVAGIFIIGQRDIKRMLAYSSVEHMGILVLALGIGASALWGMLLHVIANSLSKGLLFLAAGNIYQTYGSKRVEAVAGVIRRLPLTGTLFLAGFLAITGTPPFVPFVSQFAILTAAFDTGRPGIAAVFLILLLVAFIGMGATVLRVTQGRPTPAARRTSYRDELLTGAPLLALALLVLVLGLYIPGPLGTLIGEAAALLEGNP